MRIFLSIIFRQWYYYLAFFLLFIFQSSIILPIDTTASGTNKEVFKSVYSKEETKKGAFYNKVWGTHYRELYSRPIRVPQTTLDTLYGGLELVRQAPRMYGLLMQDNHNTLYLVRPISGATTFLESSFFKSVYNSKDFNNTYLGDFIKDAYTITHPYAFITTNQLAGKIGLNAYDPRIYYLPPNSTNDTIVDGSCIHDQMVSVYNLENLTMESKIISTEQLLTNLQKDKSIKVDQDLYIRERLFDILVGDWNKISENWRWQEELRNDSTIYIPLVVDRSHAFSRVDGLFFKGVLGMFDLKCIENYDYKISDLRRFNKFGFALDVALTGESSESVWVEQANYIKQHLTKQLIDQSFRLLPPEVQGVETELIKRKFKSRLDVLDKTAKSYYRVLKKTPVIIATNSDDYIDVNRFDRRNGEINIYNQTRDTLRYNTQYNKSTDEIWIYGLEGNDHFSVTGTSSIQSTPLVLIGGRNVSDYNLKSGYGVTIYDYKFKKQNYDSISGAKVILTNVDSVLDYNYEKLKYSTLDFSPWGMYDSDLGLYLGAYLTKTMYGFKRSPFTYRHRLGYNYLNGLMYVGSFPGFDERKSFVIEAYIGTAKNFTNFFGYGNNTNGFKDQHREYNRVDIRKYSVTPSFYFNINPIHRFVAKSSLELIKIDNTHDRYINTLYANGDNIFNTNLYGDVNLTYEFIDKISPSISKINWSVTAGYKIDLGNWQMNFPYMDSRLGFNWNISDRLTWATEIRGRAIFNDAYRFYHSATIELRGFRNNRFIGRQSLYQYTDLRFDLGNLENPFMPLQYGIFVGFDYGRVWYPENYSVKWHPSCGGGFWLTFFKGYTGKFSYFNSKDGSRFTFGLGMGF
ncbi:MAG: hypothetical protein QM660_05215 [Dysgonomonas sp.]